MKCASKVVIPSIQVGFFNWFVKELLNAYWKILYDDYEYLTSEEAIKETIEANEYDFDEDGNLV